MFDPESPVDFTQYGIVTNVQVVNSKIIITFENAIKTLVAESDYACPSFVTEDGSSNDTDLESVFSKVIGHEIQLTCTASPYKTLTETGDITWDIDDTFTISFGDDSFNFHVCSQSNGYYSAWLEIF